MDRRSWPWKKRSSDKASAEKAAAAAAASESVIVGVHSAGSQSDQNKQENQRKQKYVQISMESYTHLTGLEDRVKSYEEQVKTLEEEVKELNEKLSASQSEMNEKLSEAQLEMTNKDTLVKQHAKVAEEAVSGWEKAEAEALSLKNHLESVTLLKLTAEDRATHLDGALKECMRQIRNLKEEHEQKLHELALNKTKQFDKMKGELEAKIAGLDQELLRSAAENAALSRSLQERSNMIINLSEEKSQAEAEIEFLKNNIKSCEKEINSLKYEVHVVTKELEIRNEEKNMSVRSAEVANKQHLEGVKKIAKLEAECQRLRGLVRKKLPGPAALAQMKLEVESMGREYGETRFRRSPVKPSSPQMSTMPEFSLDGIEKYQKENELLTQRLLSMEEETKMLKEALAKRNSELQASRSICAKTASRLQSLEAQILPSGEHKSPRKPSAQFHFDGTFSQNTSNPPSLTSLSEDGDDDDVSCAGSWATGLMSELSHFKKDKTSGSPGKVESTSHLELMDDFLEMEKLANQSDDSNVNQDTPVHSTPGYSKEKQVPDQSGEQVTSTEHASVLDAPSHAGLPSLAKLQSTISIIIESMPEKSDKLKFVEDVKHILQEMHDNLHNHSANHNVEASQFSEIKSYNRINLTAVTIAEKKMSSAETKLCSESLSSITQEVEIAISQIHDFVMFLDKEAKTIRGTSPDGEELGVKLETLSSSCDAVLRSRMSLSDFILDLSLVLAKASEIRFNILGYKDSDAETGSSDCIDKVALPENKDMQESSGENYRNGCPHFSDSASDPDIPHEGNPVPASETSASLKCSLEEYEQLKLEKDNMLLQLDRATGDLETTKSQLQETEQQLAEVKSQLASSLKTNSLSETQLKCMAESYKSLEIRAEELQKQVNVLQAKIESLENELDEEKRNHQNALAKCRDLEDQLERIESGTAAESDARCKQERELAAAADKLSQCQETIFLLDKQLKALRPQTVFVGSPFNERNQKGDGTGEEPTTSSMNLQDGDAAEIETASCLSMPRAGPESPRDLFNSPFCPSDSEANNLLRSPISSKNARHRPTKSGSSSSSTPTPEKHSRGFSRFFSSKGKIST